MKIATTLLVLILFLGGLVGGYLYMNRTADDATPPAPTTPDGPTIIESTNPLHGHSIEVPPGAPLCADHKVPEMICPFHNPELIETLGWCGGHDVAEALCTRCNPTLIAAFKAEGDWCASHGLPESQCTACKTATEG